MTALAGTSGGSCAMRSAVFAKVVLMLGLDVR